MDEFWGWLGSQWGNIVGVVGVATGFIFFWLSRRPKRFGWQLMNQTPILTADSKGLPLKIIYSGEHEVMRPNLIVVRLGNRGKVEIPSSDYDRPVRVSFSSSKLIGTQFTDGLELGLKAELTQGDNAVSFTPPLLNRDEWFDLQFVTDGPLEVPSVTARVAGQSGEIGELMHLRKRRWKRTFQIAGTVFVGFVLAFVVLGVFEVRFPSAIWNTLFTVAFLDFVVAIGVLPIMGSPNPPSWSKKPKTKESQDVKTL